MPFEGELPLYQQLVELLKEEIHVGRYKQGQKLPTELESCKLYHVSRNTVRSALQQLEKKRICYCGNRERELLSQKKVQSPYCPCSQFYRYVSGNRLANLMPR